jgi:acetyltransferase
MSVRHLDALFRPRSAAVIGPSTRPDHLGHLVLRNLLDGGFEGPVLAVHPRATSVAGVTCHRSVMSLPQPPDLAVICTPAATVPPIVQDLARRGTRAAIVIAAGFAQEEERLALLRATGRTGLRLLGPNTLGLLVPGAGLNASFAHAAAVPGDLAFLSQSGAICTAVLDWALARGVGFSHFVSLGDSLDVDAADVMDHLGADASVRAILLYLRTVGAGRKFVSAARAAARNKPVLVVRPGRGGSPADGSTPVTEDEVYDGVFRRAGMLRVDRIQDLFDAAETLARSRRPRGERLALLTHGSGLAALAGDALLRGGGGPLATLAAETLARIDRVAPEGWSRGNPVDIRGDATPERYALALEPLLQDPQTDTVLVLHAPTALAPSEPVARAIAPLAGRPGHPMLAAWLGESQAESGRRILRQAGIPTYDTPDEAVSAFLHLVAFRRNQEVLTQTPPSPSGDDDVAGAELARAVVSRALAERRSELDAGEARAVLGAYGIPVVEGPPGARDGEGTEAARVLRLGAAVDPVFGPVLHVGEGGHGAALGDDRAVGLPPLHVPLARELLSRTRVGRRLGALGEAAAPGHAALHRALVGLAQLLVDRPEVTEVDVNPLRVDPRGVIGLRARVRVAPPGLAERLAIRPYPRELEEEVALPGGRRVLLRPIRPEDEPAHAAFFARLCPEDIRFRFFNLVRQMPHSQLARYTQIDYDREMAFIATAQGRSGAHETFGVVRGVFLGDGSQAEFAVVVRSDLKGQGLGRALLEKLIRYCRARATREIVGQVLPDNRPMLELSRDLGFQTRLSAEDGVVEVRLALC